MAQLPDIAGQNKVNPSSLILSAVMLLEYLGWNEAAQSITEGLEKQYSSGRATADLARFMNDGISLTTTEFTDEMLALL